MADKPKPKYGRVRNASVADDFKDIGRALFGSGAAVKAAKSMRDVPATTDRAVDEAVDAVEAARRYSNQHTDSSNGY